MFDAIWKSLSENYPKLAGYGAFIIVISWISIKYHSFYLKTKQVCDDHPGIKNKLDLLLDKFNSLIAALGESSAIKNPDFFSTSSPRGSRDENPFTKIKEYLYENAKIDRQNAITACAIYLRDKYLESYPEIK